MSKFIQVHALTVYPLSNPNRDDTGRPKTATFGGVPRLRISSQAIKRSIRINEAFVSRLEGRLGDRTQRMGEIVIDALVEKGIDVKKATEIAESLADVFGKIDKEKLKKHGQVRTRQLAFVSPDERQTAIDIAIRLADGEKAPDDSELKKMILRSADGAADIAMFGRMLADDPTFNREAAVQVSHPFTTHKSIVEDDYYTAVDDLKLPAEDMGAGFVGEAGYGSGVFYTYACIDTELLLGNLAGDEQIATKAVAGFIDALARATPSGKRNSFAHHTLASYILVEKGSQQPRSLASAFFNPVHGDLLAESIAALEQQLERFDTLYGKGADDRLTLNVDAKESPTLESVVEFAGRGIHE